MAAYVLFTVFLCQRGSSESRRPGAIELVDVDARDVTLTDEVPWPTSWWTAADSL